jgi:hypothetical protein
MKNLRALQSNLDGWKREVRLIHEGAALWRLSEAIEDLAEECYLPTYYHGLPSRQRRPGDDNEAANGVGFECDPSFEDVQRAYEDYA